MLERWLAVDHLVQDTTERPDVALAADLEAARTLGELDGLGGHVVERADLMVTLDVGGVVRNRVRNAEVDELQLTLHQDEVRWLQVGVHDLLVMHDLDGLEHLCSLSVLPLQSTKSLPTCCQ